MMRVIFFGTPIFARIILEKIYEKLNILAVVTQPDKPQGRGKKIIPSPVKLFAKEKNIPLYQPERLRNNFEIDEIIKNLNPDAFIVAAYGKILPENLLLIPSFGGINIHASCLPKYRGASPIERALMNCEDETGISIMQMEKGLDTGPVYAIRKIPILPEDNRESLTIKLANLGADLLLEVLPKIKDGTLKPTPQNDSEATYAPKISKEEERIDWNNHVKKIWCQIRALSPEPGAFTFFRGKILKVYKANYEITNNYLEYENGTISVIDRNKGIGIKATNGILYILELQPENKKKMTYKEFLNGYRLSIGEKFD